MSKKCLKCDAVIPGSAMQNGKKIRTKNRKYCFDCSPFGHHNTRAIEKIQSPKVCEDCKEPHSQKGRRCFNCYFKIRKERVSQNVEEIIGGYRCWMCGYDRCKRNIHFHHIYSETKLFGLTTRELMLGWDRVWAEMQKCVVLCSNCHGEVHACLIEDDEILGIWRDKWQAISGSSLAAKGGDS